MGLNEANHLLIAYPTVVLQTQRNSEAYDMIIGLIGFSKRMK